MNVGDRVHVVRGPWEGYSGEVVRLDERGGASSDPMVRVRLDNGSETLSPPYYFTKAKGMRDGN